MVLPKRPIVPIDTARAEEAGSLSSAIGDNLNGLYRFALRLTRNTDDAQELTQETVARAWERQKAISRNARAWLFQTLYHTFISNCRRRGRWRESEMELDEEGAKPEGPTELLPSIVVKEDVRRAIEVLPDELRVVVWLSDAEELPLREIAQVVRCPVGTVASRLWRARQELRKLLAAYGPGEEQ